MAIQILVFKGLLPKAIITHVCVALVYFKNVAC